MATKIKLKQLEDSTSGYMIKVNGSGEAAYVNPNTIALSSFNNDLATGLTVGTTTITSGTNTRVLYNNNGVVGEYAVTGTGTTAVLSTSPTFTTDITTPLIMGGSAVGSVIQYKGTSGNGTSTVAAHQFLVGNNGATTAMSVYNDGTTNLGNAAKDGTGFSVLRLGQGTSIFDFGQYSSSNGGTAGVWMNQGVISSTNYIVSRDLNNQTTTFNTPATCELRLAVGGTFSVRVTNRTFLVNPGVASSGAISSIVFTAPASTNQTAGTNISNFTVTGSTKQWATGANALQYFSYFSANTASAVGASTFTHISNFRSDAPLAGTNVTATNLYAIDCGGHMFIANSVGVPSNNPTGGGILYVEGGALKYRSSNGTVTTVGPL
jgi:hypothetical protein